MSVPDLDLALRSLPHGPEFRFIDRLLALEPGRSGQGEYTLRGDEPFLAGHFPGQPLLPGVLLVEAGAQLAGVVAQCDPQHNPIPNLKLTAIRGAKITGTAHPGQTVRFTAQLQARMENLVQARVEGYLGTQRVLQAEVTLGG